MLYIYHYPLLIIVISVLWLIAGSLGKTHECSDNGKLSSSRDFDYESVEGQRSQLETQSIQIQEVTIKPKETFQLVYLIYISATVLQLHT